MLNKKDTLQYGGRYNGQDLMESLGSIFAVLFLFTGLIFIALWEPDQVATAAPVQSQVIVIEPTPDPYTINGSEPEPITTPYVFSEWAPGWREQGQLFSWKRDDVQGLKDLEVKTTVYGWQIFHEYDWMGEQYNKYFTNYPDAGKKFLFVFVTQWMNGTTIVNDPSMWGYEQDHFVVNYKGQVYYPDSTYDPRYRIQEMEDIPDYGTQNWIRPYGYDWEYHSDPEAVLNAGWVAIARQWLRMGFSNRWDGYIVYQVPQEATAEDLSVLASFNTFGNAEWQLTNEKQFSYNSR